MIPHNLDTGDLLAVHEHGVVSWLIQTWTRSPFSHVAMILKMPESSGALIVQATPDRGVAPMALDRYLVSVKGPAWVYWLDRQQARAVNPAYRAGLIQFMALHYGDQYDWPGVWHYVLPFIHQRKGQEYCSELAAMGYHAVGFDIPERLSPERLTEQRIFTSRSLI